MRCYQYQFLDYAAENENHQGSHVHLIATRHISLVLITAELPGCEGNVSTWRIVSHNSMIDVWKAIGKVNEKLETLRGGGADGRGVVGRGYMGLGFGGLGG